MITKCRYTVPGKCLKHQECLPESTDPQLPQKFHFSSHMLPVTFLLFFFFFGNNKKLFLSFFLQNKQHKYGFLIKMPKLCREAEAAGMWRLPGPPDGSSACAVSVFFSLTLSLGALSMSMSRHCALLFCALCFVGGKSRAAIDGISLPVCRLSCICTPPAYPYMPPPSPLLDHALFALNTPARQCAAFVMKRISGIPNVATSLSLCLASSAVGDVLGAWEGWSLHTLCPLNNG